MILEIEIVMSYNAYRDAYIGRPAEDTFVQYVRDNGWRVVPHQWNKGHGAALGLRPTDCSDEIPQPCIDKGLGFRLPDFDIFRDGIRYSVEVKAKRSYNGNFLLDVPKYHHLVEVWRTSGTPVLLCIYNQEIASPADRNSDALISASIQKLTDLDPRTHRVEAYPLFNYRLMPSNHYKTYSQAKPSPINRYAEAMKEAKLTCHLARTAATIGRTIWGS